MRIAVEETLAIPEGWERTEREEKVLDLLRVLAGEQRKAPKDLARIQPECGYWKARAGLRAATKRSGDFGN